MTKEKSMIKKKQKDLIKSRKIVLDFIGESYAKEEKIPLSSIQKRKKSNKKKKIVINKARKQRFINSLSSFEIEEKAQSKNNRFQKKQIKKVSSKKRNLVENKNVNSKFYKNYRDKISKFWKIFLILIITLLFVLFLIYFSLFWI